MWAEVTHNGGSVAGVAPLSPESERHCVYSSSSVHFFLFNSMEHWKRSAWLVHHQVSGEQTVFCATKHHVKKMTWCLRSCCRHQAGLELVLKTSNTPSDLSGKMYQIYQVSSCGLEGSEGLNSCRRNTRHLTAVEIDSCC